MSEPAPTPETDAMFTDNVPEDAQIVAFCERLEIQRNAARADVALITAENERLATGNHSMEKEIPELRRALEKALAERDALRADRKKLVDLMNAAAASAGHDGYDESVELWRSVASHLDRFKSSAAEAVVALTAERDALAKERDALLTELDEAAKGNA